MARKLPLSTSKGRTLACGRTGSPDQRAKRRGARVLLLGIRMPPNYGQQYMREFEMVYMEVARRHKVPLVAFMLQGVAEQRDLMQPDNIHPTAAAQPVILETVWKELLPLLKKEGNSKR